MKLELYHRWSCPYCAKVRDFIERNRLKAAIEYIDIDEVQGAREELINLTGRTQVPCLVRDGDPLLESNDIVKWLDSSFLGNQTWAR